MNTKSSSILIIVHTEIGLLIAILYYLIYQKNKKPYFLLIKTWKERFEDLSLDLIPGEYEILVDELSGNKLNPINPINSYKEIFKKRNISEVIIQNPLNLIVDLTINYYEKNFPNTPITLITDGVVTLSPIKNKEICKLFLKHLYRKYINRIKEVPLLVRQYKDLKNIATTLISHQNIGFNNFINTENLFEDIDKYQSLLSRLFKVNIKIYENSEIIFFTQPIHLQNSYKKKYFNLIENLISESAKMNLKIIFKLHPADDLELYLHYQSNENVSIDRLNKNIPAELLLKLLKNKHIVSVASSLSLSNLNSSLKHYWLCQIIDYAVDLKSKPNYIFIPKDIIELRQELLE